MQVSDFQKRYLLKRQDYGVLYQYIVDDDVTDINWNGRQLWIDDLTKGRYYAEEVLEPAFVERFSTLVSNVSNTQFNRMNPVLEAETEELRISIVHQCVAHTGASISIRKIPAVRRMNIASMVEDGYCSKEIVNFLINCIRAHCSIAIGGLPGAGKTELLKFLTQYIKASERVIVIEDVPEIHYQMINPTKDSIELKVAENFTYNAAIKASLRQLPKWILLSEARSTEVRYLLESLSSGTCGITTLHTDDVRNIPDRIKNMAGGKEDLERIESDVYRFINVGILLKSYEKENGVIARRIEQIGLFYRTGSIWHEVNNDFLMLVDDGKIVCGELPECMEKRFINSSIADPWKVVEADEI